MSGDYVHVDGKNLNMRAALNVKDPLTGLFRFADIAGLNPNTNSLRPAVSAGKSQYDALILALKQRMSRNVDFTFSYTLARARSNIGTAADELNTANIQDVSNPFDAAVQFGPNTRTDARHRISASAIFQLPGDVQISPLWIFRSALPVATTLGLDLNQDGTNDEIPLRAYAYNSADPTHPIDIGACTAVNCGRGYRFSQVNLRVSKSFKLVGRTRIDALLDVFNLFNTANPASFSTREYSGGTLANPTALASFMQATAYAGDFHQTEQRVGQLGVRFSF